MAMVTPIVQSTDGVSAGIRRYLWQHRWRELAILAPIVAGFCWLLYQSIRYGADAIAHVIVLAAMLLAVCSWWYVNLKKRLEVVFMEQFAADNGFSFDPTGMVSGVYGSIFHTNGTVQTSNVVSGTYHGSDMRLFLCDVTLEEGRSRATYRNTVFELKLPGVLPSMMLVSKKTHVEQFHVDEYFTISNTITLEGDFSERFKLYAPAANQVEALEVFSPDTMELVQNGPGNLDIEFAAGYIYIYQTGYVSKGEVLAAIFSLAEKLIDKVGPVAARLEKDSNIVPASSEGRPRNLLSTAVYFVLILIFMGVQAYFQIKYPPASTHSPAFAAAEKARIDFQQRGATNNNGKTIVSDGEQVLALAQGDNAALDNGNYWIGEGYFMQQQYSVALTYELKALAYDPKDSRALDAAGGLYVDLGDLSTAIQMGDKSIAVDPTDGIGYLIKADAEANLGKNSLAIGDMRLCVAYDKKNNPQALANDEANLAYMVSNPSFEGWQFSP